MAGSITTNHAERVFLLNIIELAAAVFRGPSPEGWQALAEVGLPDLRARVPQRLGHFTGILDNLQAATAADPRELEAEYVRLFIAAGGGVAAPLYESCHTGGKPQVMGESALSMRRRLAEAGLEQAGSSNEPPDHLAVELEYLYHLLATGWTGDDSGDAPEPEAAAEAAGIAFASEVMLPWVGRFAAALDAGQPHPAYASCANLLLALLRELDSA
jgi:TorA-specific chaperone